MSVQTITVTPISGIPLTIKVAAIKSINTAEKVFNRQLTDQEKIKNVITLDADVTGDLADENIIVDESVETVKAMLNN